MPPVKERGPKYVAGLIVSYYLPLIGVAVNLSILLYHSDLGSGAKLSLAEKFGISVVSAFYIYAFTLTDSRNKEKKENEERFGILSAKIQTIIDNEIYGDLILPSDIYKKKVECLREMILSSSYKPISVTSYRGTDPLRDKRTEDYHALLDEVIRSGNVEVRRLISIPGSDKVKWVVKMKRRYCNYANFKLRYHPGVNSASARVIAPLTIDIYGEHHLFVTMPGDTDLHYYFNSKNLVELFVKYYEAMWASCGEYKLIEDRQFNRDLLKSIVRSFKK